MESTQNGTSLRVTVAAEVRAHMARQGRSARSVALQAGWTSPYISRRLAGIVALNLDDLEALARVLGVPVTAFFETPVGLRTPGFRTLAVAA